MFPPSVREIGKGEIYLPVKLGGATGSGAWLKEAVKFVCNMVVKWLKVHLRERI